MNPSQSTPVILVIRDGWGENKNPLHHSFNAIALAHKPTDDFLRAHYPYTELITCGLDVGLPPNTMGNSEVGHQNIGAGRIVDQEIVRINKAFQDGSILTNPTFSSLLDQPKHTPIHLIGLLSNGDVHSSIDHLFHLINILNQYHFQQVFIHAIMDGRDTPPKSGLSFINALESHCSTVGTGRLVSICGRFWAMDRDQRWDRVAQAYYMLTNQMPFPSFHIPQEAIEDYYASPLSPNQIGDEFITPRFILPFKPIEENDTVIFFNFRGDRPRELTKAFVDPHFNHFNRGPFLNTHFVTLTEYEKGLCPQVIFHKPPKMKNILGQYLSQNNIPQFRCAETEKYPHVTFFFNDYQEPPFPLEDRQLIPSPRDIQTYDQKPEMSASGVTQAAINAILSKKYGFIVINFANPDMVGHTGSLPAVIKACEVVDSSLGEILKAVDTINAYCLITADHGNAEQMWDPESNTPHTRHTLNTVNCFLYGRDSQSLKLHPSGRLADIAPTILQLIGLPIPNDMSGKSLLLSYNNSSIL